MKSFDNKDRLLTILLLEDDLLDVELITAKIEEDMEAEIHHVGVEEDFVNALKEKEIDVILSDYKLPSFDAVRALRVSKDLKPNVPFICVSGTIGEERAVDLIKSGATDCVMKDKLARLNTAIYRALKEAEEEQKLIATQQALAKQNKDLLIAKKKAEESDRLKSAFLANLSHEIRTPMNGITGFLDIITTKELDKTTMAKYKKIIKQSSDQLLAIISNILDISAIEAGQIHIEEESIYVNNYLAEIYSMFRPACEEKNIELTLHTTKENITVENDGEKLTKALTFLIDNAVKFTEQGSIDFGYTLKNDKVEFFVKDTGIGISPGQNAVIFERFRQVEENHTRSYGGNGLGLTIAKSFIEHMGGTIWLESEMGKGSVFNFSIPLKKAHPESVDNGMLEETNDLSKAKILVAEDEESNFMILEAFLKRFGGNVCWVKNGLECVKKIQKEEFDLVLMDIRMPVMDGLEATRQIKAIRNIPVIAVTAYAGPDDKKRIMSAGCDDYLSKPVNNDRLYQSISNQLSMSKN